MMPTCVQRLRCNVLLGVPLRRKGYLMIHPSEKSRYPKGWREISRRIRFDRAGGSCEWPACGAPHGELIFRLKRDPEQWRSPNGSDCGEADPGHRGCVVVLTVAHLNHTPEDCRDENQMALCQVHHLWLGAKHHARNAARSRRLKRNHLELFETS